MVMNVYMRESGKNCLCVKICACESLKVSEAACAGSNRVHWMCGVLDRARRVGHRLPWQPVGKPFHPADGISHRGESTSKTLLDCNRARVCRPRV